MSFIQPEEQYYSINITLTREFLEWTHTHRLLDGEGTFQDELWANKPPKQQFRFGGKGGNQFKTIEEISSFYRAFDELLERNGVDIKHKQSLLYLIMFLGNDIEQQSIEHNLHNHLHDYAKFLLDLIADSLAHIENMRKNPNYQEIYDEYTNEIFFAKTEVVEAMPYEELLEHLPNPKQADDVVKYLRVKFYEDELYIPEDIVINVQSSRGRMVKSLSGQKVSSLEVPPNLKYEMFTYMVGKMLDEHKKHNTSFYQEMIKDSMLSDFKSILDKNKKHTISNVTSLARVGVLVSDYLIKHKIYTSKRRIAMFLFEYFALFKAIKIKRPAQLPDEYSELIPFYIMNRVNGETIRNMMKDVGDI